MKAEEPDRDDSATPSSEDQAQVSAPDVEESLPDTTDDEQQPVDNPSG